MPVSFAVDIDLTAPILRLTTDKITYRVDENVAVTCKADDALTGLARTLTSAGGRKIRECRDQALPAAQFEFSENTLIATAEDSATNVTERTVSFTVQVELPSLCNLTQRYFQEAGVANGRCSILEQIKAAKDRGNTGARDNLLGACINAVSAHSGKRISRQQAETLICWTKAWVLS